LFAQLNQGVVLIEQGHLVHAHEILTNLINSLPPQMSSSSRSLMHATRLCTDAGLQNWALWEHDIAHLEHLDDVPDEDIAPVLERAAGWAEQHAHPEEAVKVLVVVKAIWQANRYPDRAHQVEEAIKRLSTPPSA